MPLSYVYWTEEMISDMKDRGYTLEEINAMSIEEVEKYLKEN